MGATQGSNKFRKKELEKRREINCGLCPYHRQENAGRNPRPDRYKNKRRKK